MPQDSLIRSYLLILISVVALAATGCGGGSSPDQGPGSFGIGSIPSSLAIFPSSTVTFTVVASGNNIPGVPSVTLEQLPPGLTSTTVFPLAVPVGGASITLRVSSNAVAGKYKVALKGQAGTASTTAAIPVTIEAGVPQRFLLIQSVFSELGVPIGGSATKQFSSSATDNADYDVSLAVSGLPPGTTATISPATILPGQSTTVTLSASGDAPVSQNTTVTLTGTPAAPIPSQGITFLADVTQPAASMPNNRTDYLSTEGTPASAVYDPIHDLIFSSNSSWNRIDVISGSTHAIVNSIDIRDPRGIDITPDHSTVWVSTGSQQMFAINPATLGVTRYLLPEIAPNRTSGLKNWEGFQIFALADGSVLHYLQVRGWGNYLGRWDPESNTLTTLTPPTPVSTLVRSGDGKWVYSFSEDSFSYNVSTKKFSGVLHLGAGSGEGSAVNFDGSRLVVCNGSPANLYDANFQIIGPLPACGSGFPPFFLGGGTIFSADGRYIYQVTPAVNPLILTIDATTLNILRIAPAMPMTGVTVELDPPYRVAIPFAVDPTGMVLGVQYYGIAFDDSTYAQNFVDSQPGSPTFLQHMAPYAGPLAGGTTSSGFGNAFSLTPGVWYGENRGTAHLDSGGQLTITSPAATQPGPVNLKFLFPDGIEAFDPLFFSYGPYIQTAVISGASPDGNVPGQIAGYGFPTDDSGGTVTVGGTKGEIGSLGYISSLGVYPFPARTLSFTVPPGAPGWADIGVTTPTGITTLARSFHYARSVNDYSSSDSFTAVLYDHKRQKLYLSAGDHVDVFSLSTNQFLAPLSPPAQGASKEFVGLGLTTDGGFLLATDLLDGSLAVVDPENPAGGYVIPIAPVTGTNCPLGPAYVAAISGNRALVTMATLPDPKCPAFGWTYQVDLTARSATLFDPNCSAKYLSSSSDGTFVASGTDGGDGRMFLYDVAKQTCGVMNDPLGRGSAISGDANVAASHWIFTDTAANLIGRVALPDVYYGYAPPTNLEQPRLNDAGSLYYVPFPNYIDIIDVQHASLRMRFSLGETISPTVVPLALDPGGRHVYLITDKGLTVIDLGEAPLSIGWLNPSTASVNAEITVRGSGFNPSTSVKVGGQDVISTFVDENTLTFTIPNIAPGPANVATSNVDGTAYTLQNALMVP